MSLLSHVHRPAVVLASSAVLVTLVGGTAAWSATGKTVQLSVDGSPRTVQLRGDTVADVLTAAGVTAGPHDLLAPAADRPITDGSTVALRHGRELRLVVDGVARTVWVTSDDVAGALDEAGLRTDGAALSASRSRAIGLDGLALDVRLAKTVTILADDSIRPLTTNAVTVGDALREAGVALHGKDTVSLPLTDRLTEGAVLRVTRVGAKSVVKTVKVGFSTVREPDAGAYRGTEHVTQTGKTGLDRRTQVVTLVDGKKTAVRTTVQHVTAPRDRVVSYGIKARPQPKPTPAPVVRAVVHSAPPKVTRPAPVRRSSPSSHSSSSSSSKTKSYSTSSGGGLNWSALAACESGGDPHAVSGNGLYYGLYQFSTGTWAGVGGSGLPSSASASEQTYRAKLLYARGGRSSWPVCGSHL